MLFTKVLVVLITLAATSPVLGGGHVPIPVTVPDCSTTTNPPPPPPPTTPTTTSEHPPPTTTSEHPPPTTWEPPHTTSVPGQNGGNACGNGGVQHCCNSLGARLPVDLLHCSILSGACDNGNVYCCNSNNEQNGYLNINTNCMALF